MNWRYTLLFVILALFMSGCSLVRPDTAGDSGSASRRIAELESRIADLEAYIASLENQNGAALIQPGLISEDVGADVDPLVSVVERRDGCPGFVCAQIQVNTDGSYYSTRVYQKDSTGRLIPEDLATIIRAMNSGDYEAILATNFTGICVPEKEDAEYAFTLYVGTRQIDLSNCTQDLSGNPEPIQTIRSVLDSYGYTIQL
ncbi:MAG: hypothetical protein HY422_02230 [Candidatus Komeilibacteria bacterium]|nr:hypothetical protein [Candidatus Komeilibacteria bacterium]